MEVQHVIVCPLQIVTTTEEEDDRLIAVERNESYSVKLLEVEQMEPDSTNTEPFYDYMLCEQPNGHIRS